MIKRVAVWLPFFYSRKYCWINQKRIIWINVEETILVNLESEIS